MDGDRSTANKAASNISKTVGKVNDRTKVILVKATGDGPQKVWTRLLSQLRAHANVSMYHTPQLGCVTGMIQEGQKVVAHSR